MVSTIRYWLIACGIIALDLLTKWWAIHHCVVEKFITSFISCELCFNTGISCSFFETSQPIFHYLLMVLIFLVILLLFFYTYQQHTRGKQIFGETILLAGSLANLLDRFYHGAVTDFIKIGYQGYYWPTFNVADSAICCGVVIILFPRVFSGDSNNS